MEEFDEQALWVTFLRDEIPSVTDDNGMKSVAV